MVFEAQAEVIESMCLNLRGDLLIWKAATKSCVAETRCSG